MRAKHAKEKQQEHDPDREEMDMRKGGTPFWIAQPTSAEAM